MDRGGDFAGKHTHWWHVCKGEDKGERPARGPASSGGQRSSGPHQHTRMHACTHARTRTHANTHQKHPRGTSWSKRESAAMEQEPRHSLSLSRITHLPQPQLCVRLARHRDEQGAKPLAAHTVQAEKEHAAAVRPDTRAARRPTVEANTNTAAPQIRTHECWSRRVVECSADLGIAHQVPRAARHLTCSA